MEEGRRQLLGELEAHGRIRSARYDDIILQA